MLQINKLNRVRENMFFEIKSLTLNEPTQTSSKKKPNIIPIILTNTTSHRLLQGHMVMMYGILSVPICGKLKKQLNKPIKLFSYFRKSLLM